MHLYHLGKQLCGERMGYKPLTSTSTLKQGLKSTPLPHEHTSKFHSLDTTTKISEIFFFFSQEIKNSKLVHKLAEIKCCW